jgi:hypothetical protein
MSRTFVCYDSKTGKIVSVHHNIASEAEVRRRVAKLKSGSGVTLEVLEVSGKNVQAIPHRVDIVRRTLVAAGEKEAGIKFGFGSNGDSRR